MYRLPPGLDFTVAVTRTIHGVCMLTNSPYHKALECLEIERNIALFSAFRSFSPYFNSYQVSQAVLFFTILYRPY